MDVDASSARHSANREIVAHSLGELRSFLDELKNGSKRYKTIASLSGQIAEAYRGRCVLELLQNAHDALTAAPDGDLGQITFVLESEPAPVLLIANSGRAFERRDFQGLCRLGQSPKDPKKSVGNKGLGFRSVLEVASAPEIWSTGTSESSPAFVFRFDPQMRQRVAETLGELEANGLGTRSPLDPSESLVDWTEDQLQTYRDRLQAEGLDGPSEATEYLSPYDLPLPIEKSSEVVDELLRDGHATVVRLPLDGGRTGDVGEAVESVRTQLEGLLDVPTTLFLPRLKTLVVAVDGRQETVRRRVDATEKFGEVGRGRRDRVRISCSNGRAETAAGQFLVWTRVLGGADDPAWAARIRDAVKHLPNKWPEVDSVQVGVAVQEGEESADGRFVIFLPTEMSTGTGAHVNAPFYGSLDRRRIMFEDEYNRLLLDCLLDLSLDVIVHLVGGEPDGAKGRSIIDILASVGEVGETGETMLALLRERFSGRDAPLDALRLVLCDDGWAAPTEARMMPEVPEGVAIRAPDWRRYAAFKVVSLALTGREAEVETVIEGLDGATAPTPAEWVRTVEQVASGVKSGDVNATWDGYLTAVIEVLPWSPFRFNRPGADNPLVSAEVLPVQDGRLISADGPARVFFQPVRGIDDAAELVDTVPHSLTQRIAFVHSDVVLTHEEGSHRRSTEVHKFLDGRFARGFRREEIIREVVLAAVPPTPVAFGSEEAALCEELLGWTLGLLGETPPEPVLELLKDLPVACHGGWCRARDASFGTGWPRKSGEDLCTLSEEIGGEEGERLWETALLDPGDARWGVDVRARTDLFASIGVARGLRLRATDPLRFQMAQYDYDLPQTPPSGVPGDAWETWRVAVRTEAVPEYVGRFPYRLEGVLDLPELHGCGDLSQGGRRAFSRLVMDSMTGWPANWEQVTVRKVTGETRVRRITSPLKHWLNAIAWLSDGVGGQRVLADRWLVPMSQLRGQGERFRHLRPLSLELSRRLDREPELLEALQHLGLNVYPTDGERIGPELLDALAEAWRTERVLPGQFDVFLGQVRHAWKYLDVDRGLPGTFLVRNSHRRFKAVDGAGLAGAYLPNDSAKGRALREEDKPVLEMEVAPANRLASALVDETPVRLASGLVERDVIDGLMWTGAGEAVRALEETHYGWLAAPLLAILAHGGAETGHTTTAWATALDQLRSAGVLECGSIVVELVDGDETIAKGEPAARWLSGNVLAVTNEVGYHYEALAPALQAMFDRQDLLKDLLLVLGPLEGVERPSIEEIEKALERSQIDAQAFADIRSRWAGNTGLVASRIRPVATVLGVADEGFEMATTDMDRLTDWLAAHLPQWNAAALVTAARRSRDNQAMGIAAWRALGDVAELTAWNTALEGLGDEYEPVRNRDVDEQTNIHLDGMQALSAALARTIAADCAEPEMFRKIEAATRAFSAPDHWATRWWEVPFGVVVDALCDTWRQIVNSEHLAVLRGTETPDQLREVIEQRGIALEPDPYEVARGNADRLGEVLLDAHDLHRTWLEFCDPDSRLPDPPTAPVLTADTYLRLRGDAELWGLALSALGDERFTQACGDASDPQTARERLGLDEGSVERKRQERAEEEREATRKARKVKVAGESFEIDVIDYSELRRHVETLKDPVGPRASADEFTPLGRLSGRGGGAGGKRKTRTGHRRLSPEEAEVVGIVGEMRAYRYLQREFGGRSVRASAWVSESRLKVRPLMEGERDEISDGHGFDFRFTHQGIRWHVEVKATKGDDTSFDLGISEIEAATRIARRRGNTWRWRILRVRRTLTAEPVIDWLPNPFEEGFEKHYRLQRGGMGVSYTPILR